MEILEKFKHYILNIKKEDKIAVLYHAFCCDGLCSCILVNKSIERILNRKVDFNIHYTKFEITEDIIKFFKENHISKAIFVDLSISINEDMIKKAEKIADLLVIDHHEYNKDFNSAKTTFVYSTFINNKLESTHYPASKLAFDIFSKLTDLSDLDWLACIGTISDRSYDEWKDFVDKTMTKYKIKSNANIFMTEFGNVTSSISTTKRFSETVDETFKIVYNAKSHKDLLNNKYLLSYKKKANDELKYWIDNAEKKSEVHNDLVIYPIHPKYNIGSTLSTVLSFEYFKNKTVVIICDIDEPSLKLNIRNQTNKIRTNDLLQEAIKGIPNSNAGGHVPASGGSIPREYVEKFKKQLIESYNKIGTK